MKFGGVAVLLNIRSTCSHCTHPWQKVTVTSNQNELAKADGWGGGLGGHRGEQQHNCCRAAAASAGGLGGGRGAKQTNKYSENQRHGHSHKHLHARDSLRNHAFASQEASDSKKFHSVTHMTVTGVHICTSFFFRLLLQQSQKPSVEGN